jgi:hypothetical protein
MHDATNQNIIDHLCINNRVPPLVSTTSNEIPEKNKISQIELEQQFVYNDKKYT